MTQAVDTSRAARRGGEERVMGLVGAAHFASHYFILLLPPLFPFLRKEYDVSYTDLGLALAAFNIVSAVFQTPAGFFTDRIGAHTILVSGLLCSGLSLGLAGVVPWFWFVVAMFGVAGLGNTVYHPADYAILSHHISTQRIGSAYSIHTFAGMLGAAVAPGSLLLIEHWLSWRWAFGSATLLGGAVAAALMLQRKVLLVSPERSPQVARSGRVDHSKWRLLMSPPLLRNLLLFVMLALIGGGLQNYSVVALVAARATALPVADAALTGYLLLTALGVLLGGLVAARTSRHDTVAAAGLVAVAAAVAPIAFVDAHPTILIALMAIAGLFSGLIMPSRDMIVRAKTPPGAFGTVFGFVTTGFNIGGIVAPLLFGWIMDHGYARAIFLLSAGFCLLSIVVLVAGRSGEREKEDERHAEDFPGAATAPSDSLPAPVLAKRVHGRE
jgi:MFS transporter, FSR family, fosmidomycin resistance protein